MSFVTVDSPSRHPTYGFAPMTRRHPDESDQIACIRGVVEELEAERRNPAEPGSGLSEWRKSLKAELEAQGYTMESAKRLVYPEPENLSIAYRRANRIPRRHVTATPQRAGRAPRSTPQRGSAADRTSSDSSDLPAPSEDGPSAPPGDWASLPPVLLVEDLAALFRCSEATARRHLVAGDYGPSFKLGRRWHIRTEDLRAYLGELAERETRPVRSNDAAVRRWQRQLSAQRSKRRRRR